MIGHRCNNCMWWDSIHQRLKLAPPIELIQTAGFCRKHKPGSHRINGPWYVGVQPLTDADDFCGEFREEAKE